MQMNLNRTLLIIFLLVFSFAGYLTSDVAAGEKLAFELKVPGGVSVGNTTTVRSGMSAEKLVENIVVNVIGIFFAVGGIGVVIYFVWGAVDWILSGGDKEKIANARKKMTHAIIGLVLLSLSFVIINIIGQIVGFNPLGYLQLRDLGTSGEPRFHMINQGTANQ